MHKALLPTPAALPTPETRRRLAKVVLRAFELWQLASRDQLALLGLDEHSRTSLARYRKGHPLADSRDLLDRVGHLLGIHKSLRLLFPRNPEAAYAWMGVPNLAFGGRTPVEVVRQDGFPGLLLVRFYLDRARGQ